MTIYEYKLHASLETPNPTNEDIRSRVGSFAAEFHHLSEWHSFSPETISQDQIGSRLAGILFRATTILDDRIDTHAFPSVTTQTDFVNRLLMTPIYDDEKKIQCSSLFSILQGIRHFIETEPNTDKKIALTDAYIDMLRNAPVGIQALVEMGQTDYSATSALEAKVDAHWSVYKMAMILQSQKPPSPRYLHLIQMERRVSMLIDDCIDVSLDQKEGTVNCMQGFLHEAYAKGYTAEKAQKYAEKKMDAWIGRLTRYINFLATAVTLFEKVHVPTIRSRNSWVQKHSPV